LRARIGVASATGETALTAPLRALAELAHAALRATTPDDLWQATVAAVRRALPGIDWETVALTAPKASDPFAVRPLTHHVLPNQVSLDFQRMRHTAEFATTMALRTGEAAICEDVASEEAPTGARRQARVWRFGAYAIYPIVGREQAIGLLICVSASPRCFSAADRVFLQAAAGQLALALDQALSGGPQAPSGGSHLAWEAPPQGGKAAAQAVH
jgi:GAF domain-containing protein